MEKSTFIASRDIQEDLANAESGAVAVYGLLKDIIEPAFCQCTCEGILNHSKLTREGAALEWMEEHFDALYAACFAALTLSEKLSDTLVDLPRPDEVTEQ